MHYIDENRHFMAKIKLVSISHIPYADHDGASLISLSIIVMEIFDFEVIKEGPLYIYYKGRNFIILLYPDMKCRNPDIYHISLWSPITHEYGGIRIIQNGSAVIEIDKIEVGHSAPYSRVTPFAIY